MVYRKFTLSMLPSWTDVFAFLLLNIYNNIIILRRTGESQRLFYKHRRDLLSVIKSVTPFLSCLHGAAKPKICKSHHWFKRYGNFAELREFCLLLSCIGKDLLPTGLPRLVFKKLARLVVQELGQFVQ